MGFTEAEKPRVVLECLRMIATLKLDPAKNRLLAGFVDTYSRLEDEQRERFRREALGLPEPEKEQVMELSNMFIRDGIEIGRKEGELSLAVRLLTKRLGELGEARMTRIRALELDRLEAIVEAIFELDSLDMLDRRLESL